MFECTPANSGDSRHCAVSTGAATLEALASGLLQRGVSLMNFEACRDNMRMRNDIVQVNHCCAPLRIQCAPC